MNYLEMSCFKLEELINENIPEVKGKYSFLDSNECDNDSLMKYNDIKPFDGCECSINFSGNGSWFNTDHMIGLLVKRGFLEEGTNLLIDICW
jgi:hypothetical protein